MTDKKLSLPETTASGDTANNELTKDQIDRLVKCVEALRNMSDPYGKFDTDYLKGRHDAYASVIGLIPILKINPIPTEKEIMFCEKCGEAYLTKLPHNCYEASGDTAKQDLETIMEGGLSKLFDKYFKLEEENARLRKLVD
jgi:hypothetical protein